MATKISAGDVVKRKRGGRLIHGETKTRLHSIWRGMLSRCLNKNEKCFKHYGGRGITVCPAWLEYVAFRDWALTNGYADKLSIERKDCNKGYCPENCEWIPVNRQPANCRNTIRVKAFGEVRRLKEWATDPRCRVSYIALYHRVRSGRDVEDAILTPDRSLELKMVEAFGETKSVHQWSKDPRCKVGFISLLGRINAGWIAEAAIATPADQRYSNKRSRIRKLFSGYTKPSMPREVVELASAVMRYIDGMSPERDIRDAVERIAGALELATSRV